MSERGNRLFQGEDPGIDVYDVDMSGSDALGRRGDLVRDLSDIHSEVRDVLSYGWNFETRSGESWWDFLTRYDGDRGQISVSGMADGRIDINYRTEGIVKMPDYVEDEIEFLNINRSPEGVSNLEEEPAGINLRLEKNVDLEQEEVQRYIKDVLGLYVGVDGDVSYPSGEDIHFPENEENRWWM